MDEPDDLPPAPTAAELGISEAEYARILHGLQQLQDAPLTASRVGSPEPRRSSVFKAVGVVLALAAALSLVLVRVVGSGTETNEPAYAFTGTYQGQPVTFSSCRVLQVAVYPAGGPPDAEQLVREAVGRMRSATSLDIVVTGAFGGRAPNWNFEAAPIRPGDPVSISWQDSDAIAELTDEVAGLGGSPVATSANGTPYRVAGTIALSRDYYRYLDERGDDGEQLAILLHELGHVLGLAHVRSTDELMSERNVGRTTFGAGDLEGLRRVGQGPCI